MSEATAKPRLLVLTSTFPRWQGDHEPAFVFELARRLTDRFEVTVLAPHAPGAADEERMEGVQVQRFHYAPERLELLAYEGGIPSKLKRRPWMALLVPWFLTAQLLATFRLMRRIGPHVIHAHWLLPSGLIAALVQELPGANFRLVVTAHGADVHLTGGWLSRTLKREVLRSADVVTVVSRALRDRLAESLPQASFEVAPMGVDLRQRFVPEPPLVTDPVLVFAGRLVEKKGVADLLRAMPTIIKRVNGTRLLIVGDGPLRDELHALCRQLGLDDAVEFLGSIPNPQLPQILRRGRLAVLPFRVAADGDQEGLGLVTVEAMGCGIPVITTDLPAIQDVVQDGHTGRLTPPGDPARLAERVIELLGDQPHATTLAENARRAAFARFDWDGVSRRYAQLLSDDVTE